MIDTFFKDNDKIYIHYGHDDIDLNMFKVPRTKYNKEDTLLFRISDEIPLECVKPYGGFWGSPIDSENNWDHWRKAEEFGDYNNNKNIKFKVKGNIYYIDSVEKAFALCDRDGWIDWEKVFEMYDAVEVSISDCPELYYVLYGWDVDSICVGNLEAIEIVE